MDDITQKTDIELKAIVYDCLASNENNNRIMELIKQELIKRSQVVKSEPTVDQPQMVEETIEEPVETPE